VRRVVRQQVHTECGHADVDAIAVRAFARVLRVDGTMRLLVPGEIGGGRIALPTLVAHAAGGRLPISLLAPSIIAIQRVQRVHCRFLISHL
ncbi:hypothetical protein PFISCL1PPCAC_18572, partial [Pristionchus fissidentatus]